MRASSLDSKRTIGRILTRALGGVIESSGPFAVVMVLVAAIVFGSALYLIVNSKTCSGGYAPACNPAREREFALELAAASIAVLVACCGLLLVATAFAARRRRRRLEARLMPALTQARGWTIESRVPVASFELVRQRLHPLVDGSHPALAARGVAGLATSWSLATLILGGIAATSLISGMYHGTMSSMLWGFLVPFVVVASVVIVVALGSLAVSANALQSAIEAIELELDELAIASRATQAQQKPIRRKSAPLQSV